jgi:hypothetical protein
MAANPPPTTSVHLSSQTMVYMDTIVGAWNAPIRAIYEFVCCANYGLRPNIAAPMRVPTTAPTRRLPNTDLERDAGFRRGLASALGPRKPYMSVASSHASCASLKLTTYRKHSRTDLPPAGAGCLVRALVPGLPTHVERRCRLRSEPDSSTRF